MSVSVVAEARNQRFTRLAVGDVPSIAREGGPLFNVAAAENH